MKNIGFELEAFTRPMPNLSVNAGLVMSNTRYRKNLVGAGGRPLTNALFQLPGRRVSNSAQWTATGSVAWTPPIGGSGLRGLVYADVRHMSRYNTGSDLDLEKVQDPYTVVNARLGLHGPDQNWAVELWAQNLFDEDYIQVAFDAPIQGSGTIRARRSRRSSRASTQLFGAFLGEPRTFGVTLRTKMGFARAGAAGLCAAAGATAARRSSRLRRHRRRRRRHRRRRQRASAANAQTSKEGPRPAGRGPFSLGGFGFDRRPRGIEQRRSKLPRHRRRSSFFPSGRVR